MIQKNLKPILETKYLSVENAWRYRGIMRTFYVFDQQYRHWLNKEDVFEALLAQDAFNEYTIDQCKQDLDQLVTWGNLSAVQDTTKVATYQQFMNKQFRYQMTEYSIEIERMTIRLENIFVEGGSLEQTLLERILSQIKQIQSMTTADASVVGAWWSLLSADFQRLNQNYQDYIREWYSVKAEELMKSRSFLAYKERLVEYLRHFIKELQHHAFEIEGILKHLSVGNRQILIDKIAEYEQSIPRLDLEEVTLQDIHKLVTGKFDSLIHFFVQRQDQESEVELILSMTNEIIRKITRAAANILESSNQFSSRREEYKWIATLFNKLEIMDEAHLLSANVFGISGYKHFQSDHVRLTESISSPIFEESPIVIETQPRVRHYRERIVKTGIADRSNEKALMREKILKEKAEEKAILDGYIQSGTLVLSELNEVEAFVRHAILRWIAKAIREKDYRSQTEYGIIYKIIDPENTQRCQIKSPDGLFELPAYTLTFEVNA